MYYRWAATYDRRWKHYTEAMHGFLLRHVAVHAYRNIGCGTGTLPGLIRRQNATANLYGIDRSAGTLARARAELRDLRVDFQAGDACRLPYADASRDFACLTSVFHYITRPSAVCAELHRMLRLTGTVVAVDYRVRALRPDIASGSSGHNGTIVAGCTTAPGSAGLLVESGRRTVTLPITER